MRNPQRWLNDVGNSGQAGFKLAWVLGEVAGDVAEGELPQDRRGRLALKEEAEGLPHHSLKVILTELKRLTEPLGHRHLVGCRTLAFADLDSEHTGARD